MNCQKDCIPLLSPQVDQRVLSSVHWSGPWLRLHSRPDIFPNCTRLTKPTTSLILLSVTTVYTPYQPHYQPHQTYEAPATYEPHPQTYEPHPQTYEPHPQTYEEPTETYEPHPQTYEKPAQTYESQYVCRWA